MSRISEETLWSYPIAHHEGRSEGGETGEPAWRGCTARLSRATGRPRAKGADAGNQVECSGGESEWNDCRRGRSGWRANGDASRVRRRDLLRVASPFPSLLPVSHSQMSLIHSPSLVLHSTSFDTPLCPDRRKFQTVSVIDPYVIFLAVTCCFRGSLPMLCI